MVSWTGNWIKMEYDVCEMVGGGYNDWEIGDRCTADSWEMVTNG